VICPLPTKIVFPPTSAQHSPVSRDLRRAPDRRSHGGEIPSANALGWAMVAFEYSSPNRRVFKQFAWLQVGSVKATLSRPAPRASTGVMMVVDWRSRVETHLHPEGAYSTREEHPRGRGREPLGAWQMLSTLLKFQNVCAITSARVSCATLIQTNGRRFS
jgi:hypothetical protein